MKLWQDRGEVQDSDDEDFNIEAESQRSEHVRKKPSLDVSLHQHVEDGEKRSLGVYGNRVLEEDEAEWLRPQAVAKYGRKADAARHQVNEDAPEISGITNEAAETASPTEADLFRALHDHGAKEPNNSPSAESDKLPEIDQLVGGRCAQTAASTADSPLSSVPSSPLSEPGASPPPPANLFLETRRAASETATRQQNRNVLDQELLDAILAAEHAQPFEAGRRSFRSRNEKQLHPYMFELAQFQKQFRERGMRPIRYVENRPTNNETQNTSGVGDDHSSPGNSTRSSSPPARSSSGSEADARTSPVRGRSLSEPTGQGGLSDGDDELPDMRTLLLRNQPGKLNRGNKRQKVSHVGIPVFKHITNTEVDENQETLSIPPSPPPTSTGSNAAVETRPAIKGFRIPRGLTPPPLPTPQISSDLVDRMGRSGTSEHDSSRLRSASVSRQRQQIPRLVISSDSSETETESEEEVVDDLRLRRERKRIKGVLPASWLKIDLQAQQGHNKVSSRNEAADASPSPLKSLPRKGVAQRFQRFGTPTRAATISISDDDDETISVRYSPRMRQPSISFERERTFTAGPIGVPDDDRMEVDWVDPMFATSSRKPSSATFNKRQPRITETFHKTQGNGNDFSEERRGLRVAAGNQGSRARRRRNAVPKVKTNHRAAQHHQLGIVDAPTRVEVPDRQLPAFVRLAIRTARRRPDNGRHSPTHKQIRLATREDTEEATATLRAWREGTMVPRYRDRGAQRPHHDDLMNVDSDDDDRSALSTRPPLAELSSNSQVRLPGPLRKEASEHKVNRRHLGTVRRPRVQQSRLTHTFTPFEIVTSLQQSHAQFTTKDSLPRGQERARRRPGNRLPTAHYHDAQLEMLESDFAQQHRVNAFERRMQALTERVGLRSSNHLIPTEDLVARFVKEPDASRATTANRDSMCSPTKKNQPLPHRPRKRHPHRIDAEACEYRQSSEPLPDLVVADSANENAVSASAPFPALHGLGRFGTRYATDFDVLPLSLGTYFHQSSFIGSGDFAASLAFGKRNLDASNGLIRIHVESEVLEWGAWTEEVSTGLGLVSSTISQGVESLRDPSGVKISVVSSNIDYLLRSTVRYVTRCLAFHDMVDRGSCVQRLQGFVEDLLELIVGMSTGSSEMRDVVIRCSHYALVLAKQVTILYDNPLVQPHLAERGRSIMARATRHVAQQLVLHRLAELKLFLEDNRHAAKREAGIQDSDTAVCSVVILRHVLDSSGTAAQLTFWEVVYEALNLDVSFINSAPQLDAVWYKIFTILPVFEIDADGIARIGSRMHGTPEDWTLPRTLMARALELYPATSSIHGSTINDYIRAMMIRCYRLTGRWGWWKCESVLGTMFDFFARQGLAPLHKEECHGTPRFLDELDRHPSLEVQPEDRSFSIFLKFLATGLRGMHKHEVYSDKKIGGIAWRFIPNHGRAYRKDAEVRQDDLDALRNHHSLLCTLYYATPSAYRLRVDLIHDLVDHPTSHREACRLNVRAWSNLAAFQISTTDDVARLEPFARWYTEVVDTTVKQYNLAKTEVEQDAAVANAQSKVVVPQAMIENTIARNQQQITATLVDALAAMKRSMRAASSAASAHFLLDKSNFWQVFELFDPSSRRLYTMLNEALEVVKSALEVDVKFTTANDSQTESEESQDYGDSVALHELASGQPAAISSGPGLVAVIHAPLAHLVSNIFGADQSADDVLMAKVVDVWTSAAKVMVSSNQMTLSSYISGYGSEAWTQLRDTEQRRKLTPYFFSRIIESDTDGVLDPGIFRSWLTSLVEREALLKYQSRLTSTLLEQFSGDRLLHNPPFSRNTVGHYNISLHEFRVRRVSLVSTVLCNMRESFEDAMQRRPSTVQELRRTYADLLKHLMQAMKENYQGLQAPRIDDVANAQVQGSYAEFVQHIVSSMQQYTADIQQVDRFFTDSAAFPLPATDPTYVVGRLRSYVPRLAETKKRNQLVVFVQSVSERAAVDGQQDYLVDQLVTAMVGTIERGNSRTPSLRHVLLTTVFPAYIEQALSSAFAWIVARPVLQASARIARDLIYCVALEDQDSVRGVADTVCALLRSMAKPLELALAHPGQLRLPQAQTILAAIFSAAQQCLTCVRSLDTISYLDGSLRLATDAVNGFAECIETSLTDDDFDDLDVPARVPVAFCAWPDTLDFSRRQIRDKLSDQWYVDDGQYYVKRGLGSVEVAITLDDEEGERQELLRSLRLFRERYVKTFKRGRRFERTQHVNPLLSELVV